MKGTTEQGFAIHCMETKGEKMKLLKRSIFTVTAVAILFFTGCYNMENTGGVNPGVTANEVEVSIDIPGAGVTKAIGSDTNVDTLTIKAYTYDEWTYLTVYAGEGTLTRVLVSTDPDVYKWKGNISVNAVGNIIFCARAFDSESKMLYCGQALTTVVDGYNTVTIIGMKAGYDLQDVGPAGGLIFYIETDAGQITARGWKYLEAAPIDQSIYGHWSSEAYTLVPSGTGTGIGTGKQNTLNIIAQSADSAANLCSGTLFGYSDWFLPSRDELDAIWDNLVNDGSGANSGVGGFLAEDGYWSSSEYDNSSAYKQESNNGVQSYTGKFQSKPGVRAVRSFN